MDDNLNDPTLASIMALLIRLATTFLIPHYQNSFLSTNGVRMYLAFNETTSQTATK